jgi:uncharacterized protein (TIGR02646 family)
MKRISKTNAPPALLDWIQQNKNLNCTYDDLLGTPAHIALKAQLLKEQGYLCAYTGLRISADTSHVEHLKPQTKCVDLEDVEYRNVVACFPKDGGDKSQGFGAPFKGGWWNEAEFVSPCQEDCERRFSFNWSGIVAPTLTDDQAALKTIEIIGLNKDPQDNPETQPGRYHLQDRRRDAIKGLFRFGKNSRTKSLTQAEAKRILRAIVQPNQSGQLTEFCFVFEQLLPRYIK